MSVFEKFSVFLLRVTLGWLMLYAGLTKIMDPNWSAAFYLKDAKTFHGFYTWLMQPNILPFINFVNEWGLAILGVSLIIGLFVRLSSVGGIALMLLYYLPILQFPYPDTHSFIVDEHIIFSCIMLVFIAIKAGRYWGLDSKVKTSLG